MENPLSMVANNQQQNVPVTDAQSAISNLLSTKANYLAQQNPAQQAQARQSALERYQEALKSNPSGEYTPTEHALYTNIENMGRMTPWGALTSGIGAGGKFAGQLEGAKFRNNIEAAKVGYGDLVGQDKSDTAELMAIKGMLPKTGQGGGWVTKMDKDGNMIAYNPMTNEKRIVHSSQGEAYQRAWQKAYDHAASEEMQDPEGYAHGVAAQLLGRAPNAANAFPTKTEAQVPGATSPTEGNAQPEGNVQTPAPTLQYLNKAEQARKKTFTTELETSAIKDYNDNVRTPGQLAESTLNNVNMLKQIPRTQDEFAPYREKLGSVFNALGMDGKMVNEAESLQQVRPLLAKIANDRLLLANGVQTEGDAQRAYNEFIKITDTQKAVDFMSAWAEELANRAKFKKNVYDLSAKEKGTMQEGADYWDKTDYAKAAPVAILKGKPWTFTSWRNKFIKANPDAGIQDTLSVWNDLAGRK